MMARRLSLGCAALLSACLAPPGATRDGAASRSAPRGTSGATATATDVLWIWTGEPGHDGGSGWGSCQDEHTACSAKLRAAAGAGRDRSVGLHFSAEGPEWMGFGWNWFGWWPKEAGTDISRRNSLALAIRVAGEPGQKPEPHTVTLALGGSALDGQDATGAIPIADFEPSFADGAWHDVTLPLAAMLRGSGERFDTQRAWSFTIGAWNQGERKYEIFVDDVRFP
jgi:hypothetical protein